jgi:hypothetical protein
MREPAGIAHQRDARGRRVASGRLFQLTTRAVMLSPGNDSRTDENGNRFS